MLSLLTIIFRTVPDLPPLSKSQQNNSFSVAFGGGG